MGIDLKVAITLYILAKQVTDIGAEVLVGGGSPAHELPPVRILVGAAAGERVGQTYLTFDGRNEVFVDNREVVFGRKMRSYRQGIIPVIPFRIQE